MIPFRRKGQIFDEGYIEEFGCSLDEPPEGDDIVHHMMLRIDELERQMKILAQSVQEQAEAKMKKADS